MNKKQLRKDLYKTFLWQALVGTYNCFDICLTLLKVHISYN